MWMKPLSLPLCLSASLSLCLAAPRSLQSTAEEDRCAGMVEGYTVVAGSWAPDQVDAAGMLSPAEGVEDCAAQCTSMRALWQAESAGGTGHDCSGFNFAERGSVCRLLDPARGGEMRLRPQDDGCPYRGVCFCMYGPVPVAQEQLRQNLTAPPPLPAAETCEDLPASVLELPCLADDSVDQAAENFVLADMSGENHAVEMRGHAHLAVDGLHLDGEGDFVVVRDPYPYARDATFSISLWLTKPRGSGGCSGGIYEYLFSQAGPGFPHGPIDGSDSPTVGIYIGCDCGCARNCRELSQNVHERACHGWSSASGTIIRHNLVDDSGHTAIFDFPLSSSGDFDFVTAVWIHTVVVVTPASVVTFDDGVQVPWDVYGYFAPDGIIAAAATNPAYPNPNQLTTQFTTFTLNNVLVVGGRHDLNAERHFQGRMAMIQVFNGALDAVQVRCLFNVGEAYLPEITTALQGFQDHPATHNGRRIWCWDYTYRLADVRAEDLEGCAARCVGTLGCLSFDFHDVAHYCKLNTISTASDGSEGAFANAPTGVVHYDILESDQPALAAARSAADSWVPTDASVDSVAAYYCVSSEETDVEADNACIATMQYANCGTDEQILECINREGSSTAADSERCQVCKEPGPRFPSWRTIVDFDSSRAQRWCMSVDGCSYTFARRQELAACPMREELYAYGWIEVSTYEAANQISADMWQGTNHASDDGWYDVPLSWTFMWYGLAERLITIGSNGLVTFGTPQLDFGGTEPVPCRSASEACIRAASARNGIDGLIAVFWTDLDPGAAGSVYYAVEHPHTAEAAMVIEWSHVAYFCQQQCEEVQPTATFELILYPSGQVVMQYQDVGAEHCTARNQNEDERCVWSDVSIGWEDQSGTRGGQIMYGKWPAPRTAYSIPSCAHSGDHTPPAVVQNTGGWSTYQSGDVRFWPYFDASCTGTPLAVVCMTTSSGTHGCTASMEAVPLRSMSTGDEYTCERNDSVCACALACIDRGLPGAQSSTTANEHCGGFSISTSSNSSACTLYPIGACAGSNLKLDRLYRTNVYVARADGTHGRSHGVSSATSDVSVTRPWTGKAIRELEPIILGCCVILLLILLARTIAPVKGRSISESVDAWYAARQDLRPTVRTDAGPRRQDAGTRMAGPGVPGASATSRVSPAEHPRREPTAPRPPMFIFGAGGGSTGDSRSPSTSESLENPLADQSQDDL